MTTKDIIAIVLAVLSIISTFLAYYFSVKGTLIKEISNYINDEEDTKKIGVLKKQEVIDKLYDLVPVILKAILNKALIAILVQKTFDKIEAYAVKQKDKLTRGDK